MTISYKNIVQDVYFLIKLKTQHKMTLLTSSLVPRGSPDEKTHVFWKVTFNNSYKLTTFDKHIIWNDHISEKYVKNTS